MTVAVRRVEVDDPSDVTAMVNLRRRWNTEQARERGLAAGSEDDFAGRVLAWMQSELPHRVWWLAERGPVPVGFATALHYVPMPKVAESSLGWAYLGHLYVVPEHRGAGTGRALVDAVCAWADDLGLRRTVLNPSDLSVPMYRRAGFTEPPQLLQRDRPARPAST